MKGDAFFKTDIVRGVHTPHLRIIISDPDPYNRVLVVNVTTYYDTGREDDSCILRKDERLSFYLMR